MVGWNYTFGAIFRYSTFKCSTVYFTCNFLGNHVHAQIPTHLRKKKGTDIGSGKPGQARVKAMEKREKTLLVEYLAKNKDNVVRDRRIGVRSGDQVHTCCQFLDKSDPRQNLVLF